VSHNYGPLQTFELTWKSGHIEQAQGHQVIFESMGFVPTENPRFMIHGMFDGHWRLVICAPETDMISVRNVSEQEARP
jgi:hypothetical protein